MAIYVWGAICPPHGSTLTQGDLENVNLLPSQLLFAFSSSSHGDSLCASGSHQLHGKTLALFFGKLRIAAAPKAPTHDNIPAIGCDGIFAHRMMMGLAHRHRFLCLLKAPLRSGMS